MGFVPSKGSTFILILIPFFFIILGGSTIYAQESAKVNSLLQETRKIEVRSVGDFIQLSKASLFDKNGIVKERKKKRIYVEGEVLVQYDEERVNLRTESGRYKEEVFLRKKRFEKKESVESFNVSLLRIPEGMTVEEIVEELSSDSTVRYVQPNYQYYRNLIDINDTESDLLWGLENTGQIVRGVSGLVDKDIDAPEAWARSEGFGVLVAVIDDGVAYDHPDLIESMWDGTNCVNESGGVLGACVHGYDYDENDKDPRPNDYEDDSHGTHIAGTIAGAVNNGLGIAGVAPKSQIMAIKTDLTTVQLIKAINFAENNGVDLINASWGMSFQDGVLLTAINSFSGLFITAAGNGNQDSDSEGDNHDSGETLHGYPCDYTLSNIICVAATDQNDNLTSWSDYGELSVDVGAPGSNILSTVTYEEVENETFAGTSPLGIPENWIKLGNFNYSGVRSLINLYGEEDHFLFGDTFKPYFANSSTYVVSPTYNLGEVAARMHFVAICDTPYSSLRTDYMFINFTKNGGVNWSEGTWWDEYILYNNISDSFRPAYYSYAVMAPKLTFDIPAEYISENSQFSLSWRTDSYDNDYWGCGLSYIQIIKNDKDYDFMQGTSMATPHVAGIAALVWGYRPDLSAEEVKTAILNSGDTLESLQGKTVTGKRVNAYNALTSVQGDVISSYKFTENDAEYSCSISEKMKTISCRIPGDIPKTTLIPTISLSGGSILPASGVSNNFYESSIYTLTRTDPYPATEEYIVNIEDYFRTETQFRSGTGNWGVLNTKYTVSGDFDGNGKEEIAAMYDYGNEDMSIIVFDSEGLSYPQSWFRSGVGNWMVPVTKYLTAGDFNGDGKDEIAAMYDYGNEDMAIIIFSAQDSTFAPSIWFRSGAGNWLVPVTKYLTSGDFNGDGKDELAAMYDYGNDDASIIIFTSNGESFSTSTWWRLGVGNWSVPSTKYLTSGDFNSDGLDELVAMYDYSNEDMSLIVFTPAGQSFSTQSWFRSGFGNWGVPFTKYLISGDFNGDGVDQLGAMYDYGGEDMAMIVFSSVGASFVNNVWFRSGFGNWGVPYTKHLSAGDYNGNGIDEISSFYDYGNEDMAIILFK